jgi:hypothetical protein
MDPLEREISEARGAQAADRRRATRSLLSMVFSFRAG